MSVGVPVWNWRDWSLNPEAKNRALFQLSVGRRASSGEKNRKLLDAYLLKK